MMLLLLSLLLLVVDPTPPAGVLPVGADGKALNLDFETGTLKDWVAEGDAFRDQPILGDTVHPRRSDSKSEHQGKYWIGSYEKHGDKPQGTLTSVPFKVTHPWATFLVGGGAYPKETCVELVDVATKDVFFRASGVEAENLQRVRVDLAKQQGREIQIRIVDRHTGHWGHVNFDDFRFHSDEPKAHGRSSVGAPPDDYKHAGLSPADAAKAMTVPNGFSVSVFAAEPDVHQPIAFCFDDRGRMWVVEAYTYPKRNPEKGPVIADKKLGDKILIFEDTDGDGKFDKKTVFMEGLNLVSGIELGFGGVWVGAAPYLVFIPIDKTGDKPAGEPQILLDGWGYQDTHETLNSFIWGPDGWLYGCHGVFTHSRVGKPGTPDQDRTPINAGIWRYHPTRHTFEVFAQGTSNPWGLDYNANGDFFAEACVIPHLWHIVQGGRYDRQAGPHFNPYTYDDIKTIAKHRHYVGANPHSGNGKSDSAGGGHAHSGLMCYQGGTWPKEYHGKLFMGNLHGHRINVDVVTPKGSSYEGDRNPDFLLTHDKWSIPVAIKAGPDGNVYLCDWYDKQICHRNEPEIWDRTNGRIYKISHKDTKPVKVFDLQKLSYNELVELLQNENDWYVRHARRILQERYGERKVNLDSERVLREMVKKHPGVKQRLNALWTTASIMNWDTLFFGGIVMDKGQPDIVKGWAYRLYLDTGWYSTLAMDDPSKAAIAKMWDGFAFSSVTPAPSSPQLQRDQAIALQKLPLEFRWKALESLTSHAEDVNDHNLLLLYWYAAEPLAERNPPRALKLAANAKVPLLPFMARRVGAIGTPVATDVLVAALATAKTTDHQLAYLSGLQESVKGKRQATAPLGWADVYAKLKQSDSTVVRNSSLALAVTYGDATAFDSLRKALSDTKAAQATRQAALVALLDARDKQLPPVLQKILAEPLMRSAAVRALASFDDSNTPPVLLSSYPAFNAAEKRDAIATLSSRAAFAKQLLAAVEAKQLPSTDIPAETVRQLRNLNDSALSAKIAEVWGVVRESSADRKKLINDWSKQLTPGVLAKADLSAGRAVYSKVCAQCHTLYGVGGKVGPEITGANRSDLNYLLENIFDPSAIIPKEYAATKIDLADGRVITGIIKEETQATLTVVTANETLTISTKDIDKRTPSDLSMMPDDLMKPLSTAQLQHLIAYLKHTAQVPILADADNAKDFFNGKDLSNFDGDKDVWKVDNGEIVGSTKTGLKKNTFLKSTMDVADFKLSVKVKLTPNKENSGIQFRSVPIEGGEMRGPQADIGAGWWGKLYEESARGLLVKEGGEKHVKPDEWNDYVVEAIGPTVKIWINGQQCANYTDDKLARRGLIAFQVHSGGPMEVRFKDVKLEVLGK